MQSDVMPQPPPRQDRVDQTDMAVGEVLRRTRLYYNLEIEDVEKALRIRVSQLLALEEGDIEKLPGRVYAIGFVRAYAEFLGLDGDKIVHLFKTQFVGTKRRPELNFPVSASESKLPNFYILLGSLAGLILIIVMFLIVPDLKQDRSIPEAPPVVTVKNTIPFGPPVPQKREQDSAADVEETSEENIRPVVVLHVTDNSWVEIRNSEGKAIISRILKNGDRYIVPDEEGLVMDTGNIGALEFMVGDEKIPPLGELGDVRRHILLSPEALRPFLPASQNRQQ